jgi:hypothetical protein
METLVLLFEIMAIFDKDWHNGLLYKMLKIGVPKHIVDWIKIFLQGRQFTVKIQEKISNKYKIECGVPKGAVLSPILFAIYINDAPIRDK